MCLGIFYVVTDGNTKLCGLASLTAAAAIKKLRLNVFQCLVYHAKPSQSHNKAQMKEANDLLIMKGCVNLYRIRSYNVLMNWPVKNESWWQMIIIGDRKTCFSQGRLYHHVHITLVRHSIGPSKHTLVDFIRVLFSWQQWSWEWMKKRWSFIQFPLLIAYRVFKLSVHLLSHFYYGKATKLSSRLTVDGVCPISSFRWALPYLFAGNEWLARKTNASHLHLAIGIRQSL